MRPKSLSKVTSSGNFASATLILQADDVGRCFGQPLQQDRQAPGDVVDVEGCELEERHVVFDLHHARAPR